MLVTSIFSFSHSVSTLSNKEIIITATFDFSFANAFNLVMSKNFFLVKSLPFPKLHVLDSSKLEEFTDNNFVFDENSRKLSKQVENAVGKGEIAHNK